MLIECLLRDGPTTIDKERMRYKFTKDEAGRYVCRINHPAHRAQLLTSGDAYREAAELVTDDTDDTDDTDNTDDTDDTDNTDNTDDTGARESVEALIRTLATSNPDMKATDIAKLLAAQFGVTISWQKVASILR